MKKKGSTYIRSLPQRKEGRLVKMFPDADTKALGLLSRLLTFDVDKRITIDDALNHPYLDTVRDQSSECMESNVNVNSESLELESMPMNTKELKGLLLEEVLKYNPHETIGCFILGSILSHCLRLL
eukprot:144975_1